MFFYIIYWALSVFTVRIYWINENKEKTKTKEKIPKGKKKRKRKKKS